MSILGPIRDWFAGKRNEERPPIDASVAARTGLDAARAEVVEFTSKIAEVAAEVQRLESGIAPIEAEVGKWGRLKDMAAKAGDEASVRQAVEKRQAAERSLEELRGRVAEAQALRDELDGHRVDAEQRIDRATGKLPMLDAEKAGAALRTRMAEADVNGPLADSPFAAVAALEASVQADEARAGAMEQIAGTTAAGAGRVADAAVDVAAVDAEVKAAMDAAKKG